MTDNGTTNPQLRPGVRPASALVPRLAGLISRAVSSAAARFDTWYNPVTGFGTSRDKTTHGYILPSRLLTDEELSSLYHHDDMAARMVDVVPAEMMREPFDVETGNVDLDAAIADMVEGVSVREKYGATLRWARAFGGGVCVIGADDGRDAALPLKAERAKGIEYLYDVERRYVWPVTYYDEPGDPKLGQPRTYMVTTLGGYSSGTAEVHESRLIVFHGAPTAHRERLMNRGWNLSVMQRAYDILRQFNTGWQAVENMMTDGSQGVFKMGGLTELQSAEGGEAGIQQRIRTLDFYRSVVRAIVIDADANESFERLGTSFEQIPQVLEKFMLRLAASVEIPVTILMGQSPAGMNATGESDFRWFYDRIRAQQTTMLAPRIRRLVDIWLRTRAGQEALAKFNNGEFPKTINVKFAPLWTETPLAVAQRELAVAQKDQIYLTNQVFKPEEVALTRGRPDGFTTQLQLSPEQIKEREDMLKAPPIDGEGEGDEDGESDVAAVKETLQLNLTASDLAAVTRVNEARAQYGLPPLSGADGQMTLPAFKAKYASVIAQAANAESGQDPNAKPEEPPAPAPGNGAPEERTDARSLAACVLITNGPLVLAVSRKDDPTAFGLPGGKVDPGETLAEAARRELKEETGYDVTELREVFVSTEADGFTTTTFAGKLSGKFGTSESGQVTWVHPEALFRGPFGEYNRKLWAKLVDDALEANAARTDGGDDQERDELGRFTSTGGGGGGASSEPKYSPDPKGLASLVEAVSKPDGGFTYHPTSGTSPKEGFALSTIKGRERVLDVKDITPDALTDYVVENWDVLKGDSAHFGAWHNPADGKVYLDVSMVAKTEDEAWEQGQAADQLAYFDLKQGKSVELGKFDEHGNYVPHPRPKK